MVTNSQTPYFFTKQMGNMNVQQRAAPLVPSVVVVPRLHRFGDGRALVSCPLGRHGNLWSGQRLRLAIITPSGGASGHPRCLTD